MTNSQYATILGTIWIAPYAPNWVNITAATFFIIASFVTIRRVV